MSNLSELRTIALSESTKNTEEITPLQKGALIAGSLLAAPFIAAASLIIVPVFLAYCGFAQKVLSNKSDSIYECEEAEFDEIINQINEVSDSLISMQRSSKYNGLIYKHHKNEGFGTVVNNKFNKHDPKALFNQGKKVFPYRCVMYFASDCIDQYKELIDKRPNKDVAIYHSDENDLYIQKAQEDTFDEMFKHLSKLGFTEGSKFSPSSDKYPAIEVHCNYNADGSWVVIRPKTGRRDIMKTKEEKQSKLTELRKLGRR